MRCTQQSTGLNSASAVLHALKTTETRLTSAACPLTVASDLVRCVVQEAAVSEAVRVRAYDWMREQADATVAEYVMSRLSPVPAAELATKDDVRAVKEDVRLVKDDVRAVKADVGRVEGKVDALAGRVDEKFDRLVELREADLKERAAEREADLRQRTAEREADRKDAGRRAWKIALALPVEVVVLFAGAAAILEWLRA